MALFIRRRPPERCHPAELEVAQFLAELDDGWLVRWGFHYRDNHGVVREGDFLVSSPKGGILVLEVKSGTLSLNPYTGFWNTSAGDDPMLQLDEEWSDVMDQVSQHRGNRPSVYVGRALGTPHLSLPQNAMVHHGIRREFIFDRRDLRCFEQAFDQRMRAWGARFSRIDREVFEAAFGSEGSPKAIRHFIDDIDRTLLHHTEAGFAVLDQLAGNRRFLVSGGAGTGKTWLALELARRWAAEGRDVLLLAYNLGFTAELRTWVDRMTALNRIPRGSISVKAWEDVVRDIFADAGLPYEPPEGKEAQREFFEHQVPGLLGDIVAGRSIRSRFDALVVDEGQDHDTSSNAMAGEGGWWRAYFQLLRQGRQAHVAVFHDAAQRPSFRAGAFDIDALLAVWDAEPVQVRLVRSLRYTRQIHAYLAGLASPVLTTLQAGLGSPPAWQQGIEVEETTASSQEAPRAVAAIVGRWVDQGWAKPEQILVLSRRGKREASSLRDTTHLAGHPLTDDFHPQRGHIGFGSVNRAKGLDRLAVIVVDFPPWDSMSAGEHVPFFMGVSRARQLLAVVGETQDAMGTGAPTRHEVTAKPDGHWGDAR